ncbi:hypothetical protein M3603_15145 [Rummeliibacillus stabekisii]|uniref:hypothetical protein n=1 Tax=Rummeliibacillus stabekisii TaxID=241244 RepID=UPI00203BE7DA|nr:hypothetical protein [Rummeliibacillus stabekisii]MCM3317953.1 hypothetical protein [Rummeliibacillus stabekisii]
MSSPFTNDAIFNKVTNHLRDKYEKDIFFNQEIEKLTTFYGRKLLALTNNENVHEIIESSISNVINSQLFQGYYVMTNILEDEELDFKDSVWTLSKGLARNHIRLMIDELFKDTEYNWIDNETANAFALVMLNELEKGFEIVEGIKYEVALYGAYKAFIEDSRYKGTTTENATDFKLGDPFDLNYINHQIYMTATNYAEQNEMWDLFLTGRQNQDNIWCGNAHLSTFLNEEDKNFYILSINLSNVIRVEEKMKLAETISKRLPSEITDVLQIRLYHTTEIEFLGLSTKED